MRRLVGLGLAAILSALVAGCATSTQPGAVGVGRPQLLTVPAAQVNGQAASGYLSLSSAAGRAGKLNNDPALTARVQGVARRLIAEVGVFRPDAVAWRWEVNVFDSDQINAFCAPGGKIGVFTGLIVRLDLNDDELAAVLGHEIAHALREHTREKVSQAELSDTIVSAIAYSGLRYAGPASMLASVGSVYVVQLPFSREMESEADLIGLELMARAGYDPRLASSLWRKLQAQEGSAAGVVFFKTHPSNEFRLDQIEAATPRVLKVYRPKFVSDSPGEAIATVVVAGSAPPSAPAVAGRVPARTPLVGQDEHQVRQAARGRACPNPDPVLIGKGPGTEVYSVACEGGKEQQYVCVFGNCAAR